MRRHGYNVLINRASWMRWMREECMLPYDLHEEPERYPCIAESRLGDDENPYPVYTYLETIETMRKALAIAVPEEPISLDEYKEKYPEEFGGDPASPGAMP